jgi:DNA topoisomerase-2
MQDHLAAELQTQLDRLNNQARFIQMIVNKELSVSNRRKGEIVHELRKLGFRPFPKVSKAKAAGETEEVIPDPDEEEAEEEGSDADFDYLLGMQIWSLTREKVRMRSPVV